MPRRPSPAGGRRIAGDLVGRTTVRGDRPRAWGAAVRSKLDARGCGKNVAMIANQAEKRHFVDQCGRAFL